MRSQESLKRLEQLIEDFGGSSDALLSGAGRSALMLENLKAARRYLLGGALDEYRSSLQRAETSTFSISNTSARASAALALKELLSKPSSAQ